MVATQDRNAVARECSPDAAFPVGSGVVQRFGDLVERIERLGQHFDAQARAVMRPSASPWSG